MSIYVYPTAQLQGATYVDFNNLVGVNLDPDLLTDVKAIRGSLYNILMTPLGTRYRLPEFGSAILWLLMEPHDEITAFNIKNAALQAISRWETRIEVNALETTVKVKGIDSYTLDIVFFMPRFAQTTNFKMDLTRPN